MSTNLLNLITNQLDGNVIGKIAGLIGKDSTSTSNAITSLLPKVMGGLKDKVSTSSGAEDLLSIIKDTNFRNNSVSDLTKDPSKFLDSGKDMVSKIFGSKESAFMDSTNKISGLGNTGNSSLIRLLTPLAMGAIGKQVIGSNLNANGLKELIYNTTASTGKTSGTQKTAATSTRETVVEDHNEGGGMGWMKWLLPLLILLGLGWWFMNRTPAAESTAGVRNTEMETERTASNNADNAGQGININADGDILDQNGNVIAGKGNYTVDSKGNLVDADGKIVKSAAELGKSNATLTGAERKIDAGKAMADNNLPELKEDGDGNLVDGNGKIIFKSGDFTKKDDGYYDKDGNKIGRFLGKVIKAVAGAAEDAAGAVAGAAGDVAGAVGKGAEAFAGVFTGLFSKKDKVGATHTLQQIDFNSETHRITNYSKDEVVALANALKKNPNAKIEVQVHTNDAEGKKSEKLSSLRAKVVEDMLITLGVKKGQISSKGMGDGDAAKAAGDKVEIMVK